MIDDSWKTLTGRDRQTARRRATFAWIDTLKDRDCHDCGLWFPPECMDFDHRPGETKLYNVAQMGTCSEETILAEIAKCDLRCANCHRIQTKARKYG